MNPNILFLLIDSLRSDKTYGFKKKSQTPNLDNLIKKGQYFSQAISASDGTYVSLGSIFTGQHPFNHNVTWFENHSNARKNLSYLKENGYNLYATVHDHPFFETLTREFNGKDIGKNFPYERIFEGLGEKIINRLQDLKSKTPWFYYVHIMDLHVAKELPSEFEKDEFGQDSFDRRLSVIDLWLGKILQNIDLKKTLVVITADHGEFEHDLSIDYGEVPKLQNSFKKIKSSSPKFVEPLGVKLFVFLRENIKKRRLEKIKKNLTDEEKRNFFERGHDNLFDDAIRVPLIFSGHGIENFKVNSQQVSHIDIFPTILDIIDISKPEWLDGTSLIPLFRNEKINNLIAYVESIPTIDKELGDSIGIRTSNYKYFRSRKNSNENLHLYDLILDPKESNNIANENPKLVLELEEKLTKIRTNVTLSNNTEKMSEEKIAKAKQILKELGYDK